MSKWMMSDFQYESGDTRVDREKGIIYNAAIVTPGEAKGHGVQLDSEFVSSVVSQGNAAKNGMKARFGHPSMSSTAFGTFIGRIKNFREESGIARADIFMSKEAKNAPGGDLYEYVLGMAENEADMFGTSIVFKPGKQYSRNEDGTKNYEKLGDEPFIECEKLLGADVVDEPAANPDGLFSNSFNTDTMAGQVSEFLDSHPQVWEVLCEKPEIIEGFMAKYKEFRSRLTGGLNNEGDSVEPLDATASVDAKPIEEKLMEKEVQKQINDEFGAEIFAQTMLEDGDYESAMALHAANEAVELAEQLSVALDDNVALSAQVKELGDKLEALSQGEVEAVPFQEAPEVPEAPAPVDVKAEIKSRTDEGMSAKEAQDAVAKEHPEAFKAYNGER